MKKIWSAGGSQRCFGVVVGMGQYFIALLVRKLGVWPSVGISFAIMVVFFLISLLNRWVNFKPELQFKGDL